jgi:hypothetical protein
MERSGCGATSANDSPVPIGEHASRKAQIPPQKPTLVAGFYGQAVLQS